jgi:hypothetical protein
MIVEKELVMHTDGTTAYLPGVKAAVLTETDSTRLVSEPDADPKPITVEGMKEAPFVVPWGEDNDLPQQIVEKVYKLPQMTSNLWFNIVTSYGDGIKPVRVTYNDKGEKVIQPYTDNEEVNRFFDENDMDGYLLEQLTDMHWFFNVFPEIIFNKEDGEKRKIVRLQNKEASFSRWSEMNAETYRIDWHYYFAYWGDKEPDGDKRKVFATPVLDPRSPIRHLRDLMKQDEKKKWNTRRNRFIIPVTFPTPGRSYYPKPYWYSIIESGWYDFAIKIPEFKKALMTNQIAVKYIVSLAPGYFEEIFRREKITDADKQIARIKKEYADIKKFLKDADNAGKSIITMQKMDPKGQPYPMIKIDVVNGGKKEGGDYIEDSEEVSNIISYGMLVHPSLIGASPGKNKNINGTEARELFVLQQAKLKPFRDRILRPLYLIKSINNWPADLHFVIPNLELTTLDKDKTGSVTKTTE